MKFGLFGSALAKRGGPDLDSSQGFKEYVDYCIEAEALGYTSIFTVEHHFTGFGQVSATLNLLTWVAARTSALRLGTAVTVLPWHNPVLLAEQAATLDLLSGGRLDFGVGKGYRQPEFSGFSIPMAEADERFEEGLEIILKSWTSEERFSHRGKYWRFDNIIVEPPTAQKPHPPIWMAATSPEGWEIAGRNGVGILGLTIFVRLAQLADRVKAYKNALKQAKPVGKYVHDQVGAFTIVHAAETHEQAVANGGPEAAINYLLYAFRVLGGFADPSGRGMQREYAELEIASTPYRDMIAKEYPIILKMQRNECTFEDLDEEDMVIIGDVDHCIRKVERYAAAGLDHMICLMQADRIPHEKVMRSIELFAMEIMPRFR